MTQREEQKESIEKQKKLSGTLLFYGKCGCGWFFTDYPFMNCTVCGYLGCGSAKEIAKARKRGTLIKWKTEPPKDVSKSEIRDCSVYGISDEEYDEFNDDYMDYLDY